MTDAASLFQQSLNYRTAQDMEAACDAIAAAAKRDPKHRQIAFAHAQIYFEAWRPAAKLFRDAQRLDPDNLHITRGAALALAAEGQGSIAENILMRALNKNPLWLDGHNTLSTMRVTNGGASDFDRSFAGAVQHKPADKQLYLAWIHLLSTAREWDRARAVIASAEQMLGPQRGFDLARIFMASESGAASSDLSLFDSVVDIRDVGLDLCKVRFWLRNGHPDRAEGIAAAHIGTASASTFWPYLSVIWRLLGNPRANWLDGDYIRTAQLPTSDAQLDMLARKLRDLHIMQAPYLEQSVKGGTQTDRQILFYPDPVIQSVRVECEKAVQNYISNLPSIEGEHPLLSAPRGDIAFEGSWSVLLGRHGFHARHTHNQGWISSAFYIDLPPAIQTGDNDTGRDAGWLELGAPPCELGLDMDPYITIQPARGHLVLFPSTMWHGTIPFNHGDRLTIAFDVRRPVRAISNQVESPDG